MNTIDLSSYKNKGLPDLSKPTPLFRDGDHAIYWLGMDEDVPFRCNVYLLVDRDEILLVDPGSRTCFETVKRRVAQIVGPERVTGMILCHQNPDVAASMVDWLGFKPGITVYATLRTNVLLPFYGASDYRFVDVSLNTRLKLPSGAELRFIDAPFLHFPGAMTTYDTASGFLFSGDIWAAVGSDWNLVIDDFQQHSIKMDMFHIDYMASNIATRGFVRRLEPYDIAAILPQHGSVIGQNFVKDALDYLQELECGTDVLYPDLT